MARVADGGKLNLGKGKVYVDLLTGGTTSTGLRFLGACSGFVLSPGNIEVKEVYDPTQAASPLLASAVIRQTPQLQITGLEVNDENMQLFTMGSITGAQVQALATTQSDSITFAVDRAYYLSKHHLTAGSVGIATKIEGTDFHVDYTRGLIYSITLTGALTVTYGCDAFTKKRVRGAMSGQILCGVLFASDPAWGEIWDFRAWKVSMQPNGDFGFIGDDFANFGLTGKILADAVNHPTEPNYILDKLS